VSREQVSARIAPDGGSYSEIDGEGEYIVTDFGIPCVLDESEAAVNFRLSLDEFIMTEAVSDDPRR